MINAKNMYATTDVIGSALNASWLRNQVISNNIANVDTPNYKRKDVAFEEFYNQAISKNDNDSVQDAYNKLSQIEPLVYEDNSNLSYRFDGNNVDVDTEMSYLAENQLRYNALTSQVNYNFSRLKTVLK